MRKSLMSGDACPFCKLCYWISQETVTGAFHKQHSGSLQSDLYSYSVYVVKGGCKEFSYD